MLNLIQNSSYYLSTLPCLFVLFDEQKIYTYDPTCTPDRIVRIREFINQIDEQIEANLPKEQDDEGVRSSD